jgi:hypothetical protein
LTALTVAAMSLPAFAATQPAESTLSVGFSNYREADVPGHLVVGGDTRRYDIEIRQFRLLTPVGRSWSLDLGLSKETMSGASPWGTVLGSDGEPEVIMSGATIHEARTEVNLGATHYGEDSSASLTLTRSEEDDYTANALSLSGEWTFNDDLTTLSLGLSYSSDNIEPTDAIAYGRVTREERLSRSASVGVSQVIDRSSAVYAGLSVTEDKGYLSDPYKLRDVRPGERLESALGARYRRFFDGPNAALHLDYRYFGDDWGINAHTLHTSWYQNLGPAFQVVPNVRYYSQSEADFYRPFDDFRLPPDMPQSSDFRLSAYGAFTFGLKGVFTQPGWSLTIGADRYIANEKYGLSSGAPHPAHLSFTLASVIFEIKF